VSNLILASLFLPTSHFGIASSGARDFLVRRLGEKRYRVFYQLVTLVVFAWLIAAYRRAPLHFLWVTPEIVKAAMLPVVLLGFLLSVPGIMTRNPTVVGAEKLFEQDDIVCGVLRVTRNLFLWGAGLWAVAHVIATGDLASVVTFGSIGSLGLVGAPLLDRKKAVRHGVLWERFAARTSSFPFLAIVQGRQRFAIAEIGWWRIASALALFLAALVGHRWMFGVSPIPRL
jgi:uncharacterized membrane protein